jgi:hypothetical protein
MKKEGFKMGGYDPNPPVDSDVPAKTAEEAEAIAGQAVGFRGTYGGQQGRAAQNYAILQQNRQVQQRQAQQQQQQGQPTGQQQPSGRPTKYMGWEGDQDATVQRPNYTADAIQQYIQSRPRFVDTSQFGNTQTQAALNQVPSGTDRNAALGKILEAQRQAATLTPGLADDRFFENQLSLWNAQKIEASSGEHYFKKQSTDPTNWTANTRENIGDIALGWEKAGNVKDNLGKNYAFNPNVGTLISVLPKDANGQPMGLQEYDWRGAAANYKGTSQPAPVDWNPAIDYINSQAGRQGVYGNLYGGKPDVITPTPVTNDKETTMGGTFNGVPSEANAKRPFVSANAPVQGNLPTGKDWNPFVAGAATPVGQISEGWQMPKSEKSDLMVLWAPEQKTPGWGVLTPENRGVTTTIIPATGENIKIFGITIPPIIAKQFQKDTIVYSKTGTPQRESTWIGEMAGGAEDFSYKLATNIGDLETTQWVSSKQKFSRGEPFLSEPYPVGEPKTSQSTREVKSIDPLTGLIVTTTIVDTQTTQEYERKSLQQYEETDIGHQMVTPVTAVAVEGTSRFDRIVGGMEEGAKKVTQSVIPAYVDVFDIPYKAGLSVRYPETRVGLMEVMTKGLTKANADADIARGETWLPSDTMKTYFTKSGETYSKGGSEYSYKGVRPYLDLTGPLDEVQNLGAGKSVNISNLNPAYLQTDVEMLAQQKAKAANSRVMFSDVVPLKMEVGSIAKGLWDLPREDPVGAAQYYSLPFLFGGVENFSAWVLLKGTASSSPTIAKVATAAATSPKIGGLIKAAQYTMMTDMVASEAAQVPGYSFGLMQPLFGQPLVYKMDVSSDPQATGERGGQAIGKGALLYTGSLAAGQINYKSRYELPQRRQGIVDKVEGKLTDVLDIWTNPSSWRNAPGILRQPVKTSELGTKPFETAGENAPRTLDPITQIEAPMSQDLVAGIIKADMFGEIKVKGSVPVSSMAQPEIIPTGEHGVKLFGKDVDIMLGRSKGMPEKQIRVAADGYGARYKFALEDQTGFKGEVTAKVEYPETWSETMFGITGKNKVTKNIDRILTNVVGEANPEKFNIIVDVQGATGVGKPLSYKARLTQKDLGIDTKISTVMSPPGKDTGRISWWGMVREQPSLGDVPVKGLGTMLFGDSALMRESRQEYAKLPVEGSVKGDSAYINRLESQKMGVYFREQMSDIDLIRKVGTRSGENWYEGNENIGKRVYGMKGVINEKRADIMARSRTPEAKKAADPLLKTLDKYDAYITDKLLPENIALRKTPGGPIENVNVGAEYRSYSNEMGLKYAGRSQPLPTKVIGKSNVGILQSPFAPSQAFVTAIGQGGIYSPQSKSIMSPTQSMGAFSPSAKSTSSRSSSSLSSSSPSSISKSLSKSSRSSSSLSSSSPSSISKSLSKSIMSSSPSYISSSSPSSSSSSSSRSSSSSSSSSSSRSSSSSSSSSSPSSSSSSSSSLIPSMPAIPSLPGGIGSGGGRGRIRRARNVFPIGLDISTFGKTRPTLTSKGTYAVPRSPRQPRQQPPMMMPVPKMPPMPPLPAPKKRRKRT